MRRTSAVVVVALTGLALLAAALLKSSTASSVGAPPDAPVRGNSSVREARGATGFGVYWAGDEIAGLPLTAVERRDDVARYFSFLYGDCQAGDHFGCAVPLEIQTWPSCRRSLALYDSGDPFAPKPERARARGAPAGILDEGRQLEIETGASTIVIFGESRALVNRAAAALRGVNNPDRPGDPLRPPVAANGGPRCSQE
jgi:hypothetical protein